MKRDYWRPEKLRIAARLLNDACCNLHISYPDDPSRPDPDSLPAVRAMIEAAQRCIVEAQPSVKEDET